MLKQIMTLASLSVLVPLITGIRNYARYEPDRKGLTLFMLLSAMVGLVTTVLWYMHVNNLPVLHVYTVIEFACLAYVYSFHIHPVISRRAIFVIAAGFVAFSVYNSLFIQSLFAFNTYAKGIEFLFIMVFAITYIYLLSTRGDVFPLRRLPMFWFNSGVLFYYTTSFFLYLLSNNIVLHMTKEANQATWALHGVFLILYHAFLTIALWIRPKH